ncbi:hypothetical protein J2W42_002037 [Rhizobium tibeticum]|uniref:Uncharacterized protein n=1 Tax=Rhizobium tibeticum TaxID=501024 RepID=A0A1H8MHJ2_9HYPH|nr:hypothetical protein [Rhizobium tibeticum]SEH91972.1 hypothetical protein RTCCBAU85039_3064 [Rhizobium tibeticum]SEO16724.1 hypothetical protein SAMN05216228_1012180 [Rhizobium tibeticum]
MFLKICSKINHMRRILAERCRYIWREVIDIGYVYFCCNGAYPQVCPRFLNHLSQRHDVHSFPTQRHVSSLPVAPLRMSTRLPETGVRFGLTQCILPSTRIASCLPFVALHKLVSSVFFANPNGETDFPGAVEHHKIGDAGSMADAILATWVNG